MLYCIFQIWVYFTFPSFILAPETLFLSHIEASSQCYLSTTWMTPSCLIYQTKERKFELCVNQNKECQCNKFDFIFNNIVNIVKYM